jgi:hypothetical protein
MSAKSSPERGGQIGDSQSGGASPSHFRRGIGWQQPARARRYHLFGIKLKFVMASPLILFWLDPRLRGDDGGEPRFYEFRLSLTERGGGLDLFLYIHVK